MSSEVDAARAHFEYMAQGAEVPMTHTPTRQLEGWVHATQGRQPYLHHDVDVAWLHAETALTIAARRRAGMEADTDLDPYALLNAARDRFDTVRLRQSGDPLVRARATLGVGAMGIYGTIVHGMIDGIASAKMDLIEPYKMQLEAAELLTRTAVRRKANPPLHDMHVTAFLTILNSETQYTNLIATSVPTRLQAEGDRRSVDLMIWDVTPDNQRSGLYLARVVTAESAIEDGHFMFHSGLLNNGGYPSESGQGALQAALDDWHGRNKRAQHERVRYRRKVVSAVGHHYLAQATEGGKLSFGSEQDIETLEEARRWYAGMSPLRKLTESDGPALQRCIEPFDRASRAEESSLEDDMTQAWLYFELGNATRSASEQARAASAFRSTADRASREGDWVRYFQALGGRAAALFYGGLYNGQEQGELAAEYQNSLRRAITQVFANLPIIEGSQPDDVRQLHLLLDRLLVCYAVSSGDEGEYVAVLASSRQQGEANAVGSSDVLVLPLIDGAYNTQANGRLRLSDTVRPESLDRGVATFNPASLRRTWRVTGDDFYEPDAAALAQTRGDIIDAVDPILFV